MNDSRTVAILQARMGSTRLPGKVMMSLGSRTMLGFLVDRLSSARTVDAVVVATTTSSQDDVIVEECRRLGVDSFRGSETDVLGRYLDAARAFSAELVVRVTGDNPFTDPASIDRVVGQLEEGYDYAIEENLPTGTTGEALTRRALKFMDTVAHTSRWREHVTLYAKENRHMLHCSFLPPRAGLGRPDLSYTVDRMEEYEHVCKLAEKLSSPHFPLKDLIALADTAVVV